MHWLTELIFPRRLHRLAYFLRSVAIELLGSFVYTTSTTMHPVWWWTLVIFLFAYSVFFVLLPRLSDAGMSRWWLLAGLLVPIVGIVLGILLLFRAPQYRPQHTLEAAEPAVTT